MVKKDWCEFCIPYEKANNSALVLDDDGKVLGWMRLCDWHFSKIDGAGILSVRYRKPRRKHKIRRKRVTTSNHE